MSRTFFLSQSVRLCSGPRRSCKQLARSTASQAYNFVKNPAALESCPSCIAARGLSMKGRAPASSATLSSSYGETVILPLQNVSKRLSAPVSWWPNQTQPSPLQKNSMFGHHSKLTSAPPQPSKGGAGQSGLHSRAPLCRALGEESSEPVGSIAGKRLILYSKPGCHLCDGLKEKLDMAFMLGGEHSIAGVELEVST